MKKISSAFLYIGLLASNISAASDSTVTNVINQTLQSFELPSDAPSWMKRTSLNFTFEDGYKPTYELETVQPIHQLSNDDMIFYQINSSHRNDINTHNFGLGYRNIVRSDLMLGINSFYDYQAGEKHKRWSIGTEAISQHLEFRANRYMAISDKMEVETGIFEEALDGWDAELGGLIPSTKLKVFLGYSIWDAKSTEDLKQKRFTAEYPLNNSMVFEMSYISDSEKQGNLDKSRLLATLSISLGAKSSSSKNLTIAEDLHDRLLIPVKRENEIIVERTIGTNITIGRGT